MSRCEELIQDGFYSHQCRASGSVEEGGKHYCKRHAPSILAAKRGARNAKWDAQWKADRLKAEQQAAAEKRRDHLAAVAPGLLAASKDALAYLESQWPELPDPPETTEESALCILFARLRGAIEEAEGMP